MYATKPTRYNGVNFRSRLEAKWAAFFDILKINWGYEPVDFQHWSPDFVLKGRTGSIYAEVKPIEWEGIMTRHMLSQVKYRTDLDKVRKTNIPAIVLGVGPAQLIGYGEQLSDERYRRMVSYDAAILGVFVCPKQDDVPLIIKDSLGENFDFYELDKNETSSKGGPFLNTLDFRKSDYTSFDFVKDAWIQAANATQWNGGGS